jgi:hypothetical protein
MPALALAPSELKVSFEIFPGWTIAYPGKRFYFWEDMSEIAKEVGFYGRHALPDTTLDSWLKRADIAKTRPRSRAYSQVELINFCLFCMCRATYKKRRDADAIYDSLTN